MGKSITPYIPSLLLTEDRDKKKRFLKGFETVAEGEAPSTWRKVKSFLMWHRDAEDQVSIPQQNKAGKTYSVLQREP